MNKDKNLFEKYDQTLLLSDFIEFAKELDFKYIIGFTLYSEDGDELKTDCKKHFKLKALKKMWNGKGKKQ